MWVFENVTYLYFFGTTAKQDEIAKLLMTILGIGYHSTILIMSEIGNINRFSDSYDLCSYAG